MTNRDFYTAISKNESLSDDLRTFALEAIDKLDKHNKARSSKPTKTQLENEPIKKAILEYLGGRTSALASDIGTALGITTSKAQGVCGVLVKENKVKVCKVKVPKVGERNSYSIVVDSTPTED